MAYYIKLYFATLIAFFAIDMVWLGLIARTFYRQQLGFLLRPDTNWVAAIIFYLLFILGILVFVVLPGLEEELAQNDHSARSLVWTRYLCNLRPDQSCDSKGLAAARHDC